MALAPEEVGQRIRQARKAKGWTHERLAREMEVGLRTVQRWQDGDLPRLGTLMRLAEVLDVPQAYFVETEDEQATISDLTSVVASLAEQQQKMMRILERLEDDSGESPAGESS